MTGRYGHIDSKLEHQRRVGDVFQAFQSAENGLRRDFQRGIARRTFRLIRIIGVDRATSFARGLDPTPVNRVVTSKPLDFTHPVTNENYALRFELDSLHQFVRIPFIQPFETFGVSAELDRHDKEKNRIQRLTNLSLDQTEYVNGIPIGSPRQGFARGYIEEYAQRTAQFENVLTLGEAIVSGTLPEALPEDIVHRGAGLKIDNTSDRPALEQ